MTAREYFSRVTGALSAVADDTRRTDSVLKSVVLGVPLLYVVMFLLVPILYIVMLSFWSVEQYTLIRSWTLENYWRLLTNGTYHHFFAKSFVMAVATTLTCLVIGYPVAYHVSRAYSTNRQLTVLLLIAAPFFIGTLIRVFAHQSLIGPNGLINVLLKAVGTGEMALFTYNNVQTFIGQVYLWIPFMILAVFLSLDNVDYVLLEAAYDSGAGPVRAFWEVVWPLSRPGVVVGSVLVFVPTMASDITSRFVGGPDGALIGNLIHSHFGESGEWAFGAALSIGTIAISLVVIAALATTIPWQAFYVTGDGR